MDLLNSLALPTASRAVAARLQNLGDPLGGVGLFNSLINSEQHICIRLLYGQYNKLALRTYMQVRGILISVFAESFKIFHFHSLLQVPQMKTRLKVIQRRIMK